MLRQILVGTSFSLLNIAVHAITMLGILEARSAVHVKVSFHRAIRLVGVMIVAVSILMAAHIVEIFIWSVAYRIFELAPAESDMLYFAFVNYTTLGYGDIVPRGAWRLLGPMTAMNGILLFGWSTAVIFQVLWTTISRDEFN